MPDLYRVLGLRPGASAAQVKAAYRRLVKELHPDVNAGDRGTEQRIRDINSAYQTLGDPEARAAYDLELSRLRAETRRRFWRSAALGMVVCLMTALPALVVSLSLVRSPLQSAGRQKDVAQVATRGSEALASLEAAKEPAASSPPREEPAPPSPAPSVTEPPQAADPTTPLPQATLANVEPPGSEPRAAETPAPPRLLGELRLPVPASLAPAAPRKKPAKWATYQNARFGFSLRYPVDVFLSTAGDGPEGNDRVAMSKDGRAFLWIAALPTRTARSIADYRQALMRGRYAGASFDYTPLRSDWFVLSGSVGDEMFYERVTFSCDRQTIHRWLLLYPVAERAYFDEIVEEMHRSYRYDLGARERCAGSRSEEARAGRPATGAAPSGTIHVY